MTTAVKTKLSLIIDRINNEIGKTSTAENIFLSDIVKKTENIEDLTAGYTDKDHNDYILAKLKLFDDLTKEDNDEIYSPNFNLEEINDTSDFDLFEESEIYR